MEKYDIRKSEFIEIEELNKIKTTPMLNTSMAINYDKSMSPEEKVNYLAQNLRLTVNNLKGLANWTNSTCLDTKWTPFKKDDYDIENDALNDEGKALTELLIKMQSNKEGMSFEKIDISSLSELYSEEQVDLKSMLQNNTHSFTIATIDDKKYIIDCAYRQFFEKGNSQKSDETIDLENIMSNDEHSKALAEQILRNGWAEANPENIKTYLDGFIKATAKDTDVRLPNEEDYLKNIRGKDLDVGGKVIHRYEIKELWKPYVKRYSPNISEEILDFMQEHRDVVIKIKNNLVFSTDTFSIISKAGKEYIRTEDGDVEYTPESFKTYLDTILIQAGETEDIVTPSIKEYHSLYPCGKPVAKDYKYIIDSKPYIYDIEIDDFSEEMSDEEKITSIVQKERRFLMRDNDLETASLAGECEDSTLRVMLDSTSKGFEDATCLFPGTYLKQGSVGHNCSIVKLNGKSYLIDCTYRQFFEEGLSEHCGKYMINDENRRNVAEQILRNGWIEATPENIKAYMDGFEMANRKSFEETGITNEEYIKRLAEHETRPIHIVTKREILELGIEANMSIEEVQNAGQLLEEPVKSNEISISE